MNRDSRRAFEWSLASVCLGAPLLVAAVVAINCGEYAATGLNYLPLPDPSWAAPVFLSFPGALGLLSLVGAAAGIWASALSRASSRPVAFGLVGAALCLSAAFLWTLAAGSWYAGLVYYNSGGLTAYGSSMGS